MDNTKKLGLILSGIVLVVILILAIYFITYLFNIKDDSKEIITTTSKPYNVGYKTIPKDTKEELNRYFNNDRILKSLNNAFDNNFNIKNINLLEKESSKFKFIYTYLKLNDSFKKIDLDLINNYSNMFFQTNILKENIDNYYKDGNYFYEYLDNDTSYCLKATLEKDNNLLLDMIKKDKTLCDTENYNYKEEDIIHKIKINYNKKDELYILNSFIVIK